MGFFNKKETETPKPVLHNYADLNADLGFLLMVFERKKKIALNYLILPRNSQLDERKYINTNDITDVVTDIVNETISLISTKYKEYLLDKFFSSETALISFLVEDAFNSFIESSTAANMEKMKIDVVKQNIKKIRDQQKSKN